MVLLSELVKVVDDAEVNVSLKLKADVVDEPVSSPEGEVEELLIPVPEVDEAVPVLEAVLFWNGGLKVFSGFANVVLLDAVPVALQQLVPVTVILLVMVEVALIDELAVELKLDDDQPVERPVPEAVGQL